MNSYSFWVCIYTQYILGLFGPSSQSHIHFRTFVIGNHHSGSVNQNLQNWDIE